MRKITGTFLICTMTAASLSLSAGCGTVTVMTPETTVESRQEQIPARPQDDFYRYVNEEYLKNVEFKYGESSAGVAFDQDMVTERIRGIIKNVAAGSGYEPGSEEYIIKQAYDLCISYDYDNTPVPGDLAALMNDIDNAGSVQELMDIDARMCRDYGCGNILNCSETNNYLMPGHYAISFKNYSGIEGVEFKAMTDSFSPLITMKQTGSNVMQYMGHSKAEGDDSGAAFCYMIMDICSCTNMDIIMDSMPLEYYFELTYDEAQGIFTNIDLDRYFTAIGFDMSGCNSFVAIDRGQLEGLNSVLTEENLEALKVWELVKLIREYNEFITPSSDILLQYYNKDYRDAETQTLETVAKVFYEQTDPLYVEQYYTEEMDTYLRGMCDDIKEGYRNLITNATWLTEDTRAGLITKLDNIIYVTGSNLERHDNSEFTSLSGNNYYEFYRNYKQLAVRRACRKLGTKTDRTTPNMPMQMFNACYDPSLNNITITAAMMNAPFYDPDADYYTNLGGIGFTIAHEMGHAFDSNCIEFDSNGVYDPSWICREDMDALRSRNDEAVRYFEDNFTVFGVYHVNGKNTLGENYADLGGMECIVSLTDTNEQRRSLFTNYAVTWREKQLDSEVLDQLGSDEHSPAVIRVNAILATLDEFYETYGVSEGDGMYIEPDSRISRWH